LLDEAEAGQSVIYMSVVNLIEVYYGFYREFGQEKSSFILEQLYTMPIHFIDTINATVFSETIRLKAQYSFSLADAIGVATAIDFSGVFVTADHHELDSIAGKETIEFLWFR